MALNGLISRNIIILASSCHGPLNCPQIELLLRRFKIFIKCYKKILLERIFKIKAKKNSKHTGRIWKEIFTESRRDFQNSRKIHKFSKTVIAAIFVPLFNLKKKNRQLPTVDKLFQKLTNSHRLTKIFPPKSNQNSPVRKTLPIITMDDLWIRCDWFRFSSNGRERFSQR